MASSSLPDPNGLLRLHHGTDLNSALDIMHNGLDQTNAAALNVSGEFWATTDQNMADVFAQVNPTGGQPARLDFDIPLQVVLDLIAAIPPQAIRDGEDVYEFLPSSYAVLNQHLTNRQVVSPVP